MTDRKSAAGVPSSERLALLWRFARPRRAALGLALALGLVASGMGLVGPLATKWVLDALGAGQSLAGPVALLAALLVVGALVTWWQWVILGSLAEHIVYEAREGMIRRFLTARIVPLQRRRAGELVTRVTSDSVLLREAASSSVIGLINGAVMLVGTVVLMAVLDLVLVLATVAAVGVVVLLFVLLMPAIARAQQRSQAALGELGGALEGSLRAIRTVKAAGAEPRQLTVLLKHADESRRQSIRSVRREALVWTVAWTGVQTAIIVILALGAWRVAGGDMTVSTLIAFLLYAFGLLGPIMDLSGNLTTLQSGLAAAGRIAEVERLETESTVISTGIPSAATVSAPDPAAPIVRFEGVTARYDADSPAAVTDLDLDIRRQGHTAIVGPSGAGKTTVLSLMLRFVEPERGRILLDGRPFDALTPAEVRTRFAYVEQESPVVPGTIRDNLLFVNQQATPAEVDLVLQRLRLGDKIASLPDGLDTQLSEAAVSGGQRQRIALARALLAEPAVLLLDEATAQVDGITEAAVQHAVREQADRAAVVTVAHRLSTVLDADHIVVMDDAKVVAAGTHPQLLQDSELYRELVAALRIEQAA